MPSFSTLRIDQETYNPYFVAFMPTKLTPTELYKLQAWFNKSYTMTTQEERLLDFAGDIKFGENFTFEDLKKIVLENRAQCHWFEPSIEVPLILAYVFIIVFGFIANGVICYIVCKRRKLRTVRNLFIMNLAVSDLIMCFFCMPLTLIKLLLKNWPLGEAMCRLVPWLQGVNVFASTMTITAIAMDRYQIIVFPSYSNDNLKKLGAITVIIMIWFISVIASLPLLVYSKLESKEYIEFVSFSMCLEEWPSAVSRAIYASIIMALQFLLPISILIVIHWKICSFLKTRISSNPTTPTEMNRAMKEANRHRKNSTLLMAIAVMFAVCWFPLTLLNLLADYNYFIFMFSNFQLTFAVAHLIANASACLNPVIYGWFNANFRREMSALVCFWKLRDTSEMETRQLVGERVLIHEPIGYKSTVGDRCMFPVTRSHRDGYSPGYHSAPDPRLNVRFTTETNIHAQKETDILKLSKNNS